MLSLLRTGLPATAFLSVLLFSGCGYHLGEIRPTPMRSVQTVAVQTFKNETYRPRLEVLMADTLIRSLQNDGTYQITSSNRADAIIYGTLVQVNRFPIRSALSNVLQTLEYQLTIIVNYEVQDRISGAILMEGSVTGSTTFFPTGDLVTDERQALSVAAQRASENLSRIITTGW
jgi:outer membrane lipopolysaccharide assembly protein LptE/RlpB